MPEPHSSAPTKRFTERVEDYVKARPEYPAQIISLLEHDCGFAQSSTVVDVGCGTGLLAKLFCEFGCHVIGVEPNDAMREAGKQYLAAFANFEMLEGQAESIPLMDSSADFIVAGQAFHWFNIDHARREFMRVLKPLGWAVLIWNDREFSGSRLADAYEELLVRFGIDYANVHQRGKATLESFEQFFGHDTFRRASFLNPQRLDHGKFVARVLSASYMPGTGHVHHDAMMQEVERIFAENAQNGVLTMNHTTTVTYGHIT